MMSQASLVSNKPSIAVVARRIMTNGSWKTTAVGLGYVFLQLSRLLVMPNSFLTGNFRLDAIYIYRSEEATKLRSSLPLRSVTDLEVIEDDEGMPHKYGVRAVYGAGDTEKVRKLQCHALIFFFYRPFSLFQQENNLKLGWKR